jgi:hypothetical protein
MLSMLTLHGASLRLCGCIGDTNEAMSCFAVLAGLLTLYSL